MNQLSGLNSDSRQTIGALIRNSKGPITISEAAKILNIGNNKASRVLSYFTKTGWLTRIKQGLYLPLATEAQDCIPFLEDNLVAANKIFAPCYIGGWSALEYWSLTEQIFNTTVVLTSKTVRNLYPEISGSKFLVKVIAQGKFFGLSKIWRGNLTIEISDPSRTIVDILDYPELAGGIRPASDAVQAYFKSEYKNNELLVSYIEKSGNRTIYKRLGFLLEYLKIAEPGLIVICQNRISMGNSKLDPSIENNKLTKRWRLWMPAGWKDSK